MNKLFKVLLSICVVAVSIIRAFWQYIQSFFANTKHDVKSQLANGLALSLEFKMAAEILKTVLIRDFEELIVLGAVIALRALLSILIHFEMKHSNN